MTIPNSVPAISARLQRLLKFLEQDAHNIALLNDALELAIDHHDVDNGQRLITHATTHHLSSPQFHAHAAHLLLIAGDYSAAAKQGLEALNGGIHHPAVLFNTAFAYFYCHDYAQTAALLEPLIQHSDCTPITQVLYARALHHLERAEEALDIVTHALQQDPTDIEAYGLLSLLQYENDQNEAALLSAHEVLALNPSQLDALLACGAVQFELGNIEAARRVYTHTVNIHPTCGRAWSGLAEIEFNALEFDLAEQHLDIAVRYMPNHIGTWHLLAWIYILRNNSHKAREALNHAYALDRNFGETHGGLAVVDVMDGYDDNARIGIKRALKLNSQGMAAQYAEMLLLKKSGNDQAAASLIQGVLERAVTEDATGYDLIARQLEILKLKK